MTWIEIEPTFEYPFYRYYTAQSLLIGGKHYYGYFTLDEGRYRGWILSTPGSVIESYIDVETKEEAEEYYKYFLKCIGG